MRRYPVKSAPILTHFQNGHLNVDIARFKIFPQMFVTY